jgi:hypothetical protein
MRRSPLSLLALAAVAAVALLALVSAPTAVQAEDLQWGFTGHYMSDTEKHSMSKRTRCSRTVLAEHACLLRMDFTEPAADSLSARSLLCLVHASSANNSTAAIAEGYLSTSAKMGLSHARMSEECWKQKGLTVRVCAIAHRTLHPSLCFSVLSLQEHLAFLG